MVGERRAPGVQDGGEADARAQMLRVGGDRGQRLGGGPEQQVVDGRLVRERDGADRCRQGEDDVVIGNRQQLGLAVFEPLSRRRGLTLRAVAVAAGIVGDPLVRAVLAALDVSAERGRATGLDRRHDLQLGEAEVTGVGLPPRRPMGAKDVGDLEARPRHAALGQPGGVRASGIYAMQRFAKTIRQDLEAVRNAVSEPWSNGQTEGQINRLKTLKRAMYGRAGVDLLRARMMPL